MSADSSAENTPNAIEFICPIYLLKPKTQAQSNEKKASLDVRSPWHYAMTVNIWQQESNDKIENK